MSEMGKAMMGTGEASGEKRAIDAAEAAINNPLLEDASMKGAKGVLINITGGFDMTLFEVDEAANRIREEVDGDANIIFGSTFDEKMEGVMRVSVVATGIAAEGQVAKPRPQLSVVTPRPVKAPEPEPVPEMAILADAAPAVKPAASMSTLDITRQAESGIGELSFPEQDEFADLSAMESSLEETDLNPQIEEAEIVGAAAPAVAKVASDAFVPSASTVPQRRPDMTPKAADPFRGSDMVNASRPDAADAAPKSRSAGLFRQITGLGLKADKPAEAPAAQQPATPRPAAAQTAQPRLGALNPGDRVRASQSEDEMLDIPAFLRRQAN
jgi:cell division protein FtsZ